MNRLTLSAAALFMSFSLGFSLNSYINSKPTKAKADINLRDMKLGAFSISLSVKDLDTSKKFYKNLGFTQFGGAMESNYLIMKNENALIGLFQGMFEDNMLTFNPGWDENANEIEGFQDVRKIQQHLKSAEIEIINAADENSTGPASFLVKDPDGNMLLFDQHL
ncbi:hypothetical protein U3A58_14355 [Algoriphagus sp. C2-6-M1]|uniref:VOC family protein n=1 Tax=Algoriphagus persicinus TaxID=3108754 RepID=UPI002B3BE14F|nr:VOC family protein [Algoriphagus sp. C2-6-M1]MEB2781576.1 hypothetical protein [Algoriphagus sp. C2-6-M1]